MTTDLELFYDGRIPEHLRNPPIRPLPTQYLFEISQWCKSLGRANQVKDPTMRRYYQSCAMKQINYYRKLRKQLLTSLSS